MTSRPTTLWIVKYRNREATMLAAYFTLDEALISKARLQIAEGGGGTQIGDVEMWTCRVSP